jgi:hypothetical protein
VSQVCLVSLVSLVAEPGAAPWSVPGMNWSAL